MTTVKRLELKKLQTEFPAVKITSSKIAADFARQFYSDDIAIFESFFILVCDRANNTISYAKISQGGVSGTVVDVRLIAKYAVDSLGSGVILFHNHPSGNKTPSEHDIQITKKAKNALSFLDIKVLDHIILTEDSYYSLLDEGEM
jgi:DNA repair protein RadC